jgi:hypothetical protein
MEVRKMRQRLLERPKPRRQARVLDPLPIDPRDPDVVRVKQRLYAEHKPRGAHRAPEGA